MTNREKLRARYLRDAVPVRLGGLAATLARISSSARDASSPAVVANLLDEAKHLIEWTAVETSPDVATELVQMQRLIVLWERAWSTACQEPSQRVLLSAQAKAWSNKALEASGLMG
ncbi:MAG: hypothetical protein COZ56_04090 [Armatimonadetes bacterium CG_4_8_14_3_um_filter_58_9]|nr:MAG: hypothetical protein COZ56_04090 [Armatimonadetes bacterium CG_4_8_14_3_um_filter_58_9]